MSDDGYTVIQGGGAKYEPPRPELLDRRLRMADQPGKHLWAVTAVWRVAAPGGGEGPDQLDAENLIAIAGPGCYKCEHPYSSRLARKPCRGSGMTWGDWQPRPIPRTGPLTPGELAHLSAGGVLVLHSARYPWILMWLCR